MSPPDDPLEVSPDSYQLIKGYFLGQKVPFRMMKTAMMIPGKGPFCVYMALWVLYSAKKRRKIILHRRFLKDSGLAASTISSALNRLVDAGLISQIKRGVGQSPVIYLKKESEVFKD